MKSSAENDRFMDELELELEEHLLSLKEDEGQENGEGGPEENKEEEGETQLKIYT